ncbi:hypothetical protein [Bradyrhizobium sp. HKCCYLRH1030]|uniref:hypothetical protein n=1 Tax=Bradyrhizobium sp. HKCCYLRH1030 TaxID=3420744 RepID=UPI003EB94DD8
MGLAYENLTADVRALMVEEIQMAIADGSLYVSSYLSPRGREDWSALLVEAAKNGNDDTLAAELKRFARIAETTQRRKPSGGYTTARVPYTAAETMAEGEFNRFYCRGLCRFALSAGVEQLQAYRAKAVAEPRPGSEQKIGMLFNAKAILDDLRTSAGVEPTLGLPPGPNSGLTLRLP